MILFPIISIVMIVVIIIMSVKIEKNYSNFVAETESESMLFLLRDALPHRFFAMIAVLDFVLLLLLYFFSRYSDEQKSYFYAMSFFTLIAIVVIFGMVHVGTWCVIGFKDKIAFNTFLHGRREIRREELKEFRNKNQKKYIIKDKEKRLCIKSEEVHIIVKRDDGTIIESPLLAPDFLFDNNPITNLIDSWKTGEDNE